MTLGCGLDALISICPVTSSSAGRLHHRSFHRVPTVGAGGMEHTMKGHVKQRGGRYYAVIYEGLDPITGRKIRRWHPAGTDRAGAERLAAKLARTRRAAPTRLVR